MGKKYTISMLMPEELYKYIEKISIECEQTPTELLRDALRVYLAGHVAQREGGGLFIKSDRRFGPEGFQINLGGVDDLDGLLDDIDAELGKP